MTRGFDWGGLYQIYNRCSCWCCPLQRIGALKSYAPITLNCGRGSGRWTGGAIEQFGHNALGQFTKNWTVEQLERRFANEDRQISVSVREER